MLRVLRLGSSIDIDGETTPAERAGAIAEAMLAEASGEQVETVMKLPWPSPKLAELVEEWVKETEPDIVCFNISSYWCESQLVNERLRDFGPPGRFIARWLAKETKDYGFNASRMVRWGRTLAAFTIGGRPPFAPADAAERIDEALRRILRYEHISVVVAGSPFSAALEGGAPARRRARARRADFFTRLQRTCDALHIPADLPPHAEDAFTKGIRSRDRLHFGPDMQRRCGEIQGRLLVAAWKASVAPERTGTA